MVAFSDHFWGEKHTGFDVLQQNMKHGTTSTKEFHEFLKESCVVEENYSKLLLRLSGLTTKYSQNGTFYPYWQLLKDFTVKLSSLRTQLVLGLQEIMKGLQKYQDEQQKRQKQVKEQEAGTSGVVQDIQQITVSLGKAKENYHTLAIEYEKLKRENAALKHLEKAEVKMKKAGDDYRTWLTKYETARNDFERKFSESCQRFQDSEEKHIQQMKDFITEYIKVLKDCYVLVDQAHQEFVSQSGGLTISELLQAFINSKQTGSERPGPLVFEEPDYSALPLPAVTNENGDLLNLQEPPKNETKAHREESLGQMTSKSTPDLTKAYPMERTLLRFLNKNKGKKPAKPEKEKKTKVDNKKGRKTDKDSISEKSENSDRDPAEKDQTEAIRGRDPFLDRECRSPDPHVDADGYSIPPPPSNQSIEVNNRSSDSSDDSDGEGGKKFMVNIKPTGTVSAGTVSNEVLKSVISQIQITNEWPPTAIKRPTKNDSNMTRSISLTTNNPKELQHFDGFRSSPVTQFERNSVSSMPGSMVTTPTSTPNTPLANPNPGDIFSIDEDKELVDIPSRHLSSPMDRSLTPGSSISRRRPPMGFSGGQSPSPVQMTRTESLGSLSQFTHSSVIAGSRGPSPVSIGMSDPVPVAAAFMETVHAYLKGTDPESCKMKLIGDVMFAFPSTIVKVLSDNPNPSTLTFRINNLQRIENIRHNSQLISKEELPGSPGVAVYSFDMVALSSLLRRQYEENRAAKFFNIDVLKYEVKHGPGISSAPLHLVAYWKFEPTSTALRIDYKSNSSALNTSLPLQNVTLMVPVTGDSVQMTQSLPNGRWAAEEQRLYWSLGDMKPNTQGELHARFDLAGGSGGSSSASAVAVNFACEGCTMSGVELELLGGGFRLTMVKKKVTSGRYTYDTDRPLSGTQ